MFHLIVTVCLALAADQCGQVLLPRGDSPDRGACLAAAGPVVADWMARRGELTAGPPDCVANADLPALPLEEVAPGVLVHPGRPVAMEDSADGHIANLGVVIGRDAVAVIDAGTTRAQGQALYVAIRRRTDLPIRHVVLTHMHPDHVLGAAVLAEAGAQVVAHHAMPAALQARADGYLRLVRDLYPARDWIGTAVAMPDRLVEDRATLDLGDRELDLRAWPAAHTDNDLTVTDRRSATLFAGDLLFRDLTPVVDGSLRGWLEWLDSDPAAGARWIVPGHGPVGESWDEVAGPQTAFLKALADRTRAAIDRGLPLSEAVPDIVKALQGLRDPWNDYDVTVARDATAAYKELEWE